MSILKNIFRSSLLVFSLFFCSWLWAFYVLAADDRTIKFESYFPGEDSAFPVPTSPPTAISEPPAVKDQPSGVCTDGGPGVTVSELFLFYKRQGIGNALALAQKLAAEYTAEAYRIFSGQPCIDTVVKALVRVAIARGEDFFTVLASYQNMSTYEIMAAFPKQSSTPLYAWAPTPVAVKIDSGVPIAWSIPVSYNNGWEVVVDATGILHRATGERHEYISYGINHSVSPKAPKLHTAVSAQALGKVLTDMIRTSGLPSEYHSSALASWVERIPQAPFYSLGVYGEDEVSQVLSLSVRPQPENLGRLVLYVKPLLTAVKSEENPPSVPILPPRHGLTVYDVGLVVEW